MTERTAQILEAVIQEFIDTGNAVSSGLLYEKYDFGIKPAMIRLELDDLEEQGYLEQPHHSAGRVPTNKGYEFFARQVLSGSSEAAAKYERIPERKSELREHVRGEDRDIQELLDELSSHLGILGVAADLARDAVYKAGLQHLIDNLDWQDQQGIRSVIHDFDEMDGRLSHTRLKLGDGPQIFIGKKSPVTTSDNLSVIGGNYRIGDATISIFAIGPKRMDYKKVIQIFREL